MNIWRSLAGEVEVKITSADISAFLDFLGQNRIPLNGICWEDELTVSVRTSGRDGNRIRNLANKKGITAEITGRTGAFWKIWGLRKRPVLIWGLAFLLILSLYLPTRVLFIRVEGNQRVPTRQILASAEECGIRFGAKRREVRSEKMKNALLGEMPQLQWAGVNTSGCVATITVRERSVPENTREEGTVSSIIACRDGVILSCTAEAGSLQCSPGQAVREGQVLISGYTDCGLLIRAARAQGEVFALTRHRLEAVAPVQILQRCETRGQKKYYSLILGKKRINFYNSSGICDTTCGRMYAEYYIYLPGGFRLPLALAVETHTCWDCIPGERRPEEGEQLLTSFLQGYAASRMISGEILRIRETFGSQNGLFRLEGDYFCREMIGRVRQEGKVELDGKSG